MIFLPLKNFEKSEDECETHFECWLYVLKNMEKLDRMPFKAQIAVLEKLEQIASVASLSEQEEWEYERTLNDFRTALATWEFAEENGEAQGRAEGEAKTKIEIARNLKGANVSIDIIMEVTGLTREEVEQA
jgi:predicted transposase/invertase (TIGR01784 family)